MQRHTPVVKFLIQVNLDDVEPLKPGEAWNEWNFSFPVLPMIEDLSMVDYAGNLLRDILCLFENKLVLLGLQKI